MPRMGARLYFLLFASSAIAIVACGARSALEVDVPEPSLDAGTGAEDAPPDVSDAGVDAPPPTCDDAGVTYIYAVTSQGTLVSYYPPSGAITPIGTIDCPVQTPGSSPYSMAVDRGGTAYVVFDDGNLYKVSTADASCEATSFVVGQHGFVTFGLAFSADEDDPGETLFVAEEDGNGPSRGLATIDVNTFELSFIGPFSKKLGPTELTGTGDGRLFGFSVDYPGPGSHISQIDKATAKVFSSKAFSFGGFDDGDTFAFWGGSFYVFDAPQSTAITNILRWDLGAPSAQLVGMYPDTIVGAGVSTCAPQ